MEIGPGHVGRRVSVRRRLSDGSATDVVGRLLTADDGTLRIARRDGSEQAVDVRDVIAARVVPDRPARTRRAADVAPDDLARIASRGWPALESVPLGDWELRASSGFTSRANSAAITGEPGIEIAAASDAVRRFYTSRGLPPLAQIVVGSPGERRLRDLGWRPVDAAAATGGGAALVQVADLSLGSAEVVDVEGIHVDRTPKPDWWDLYHRIGADEREVARRIVTGPSVVGFAHVGDPLVGIGRVVVSGEWAGIAAVEVDPSQRRQGLARRIVAASLAWVAAHGADKAYLQVTPDNTAAIALYAAFGFTDHHRYAYLQADPLDPAS